MLNENETSSPENVVEASVMRPVQLKALLLFSFVFLGSIYFMWSM